MKRCKFGRPHHWVRRPGVEIDDCVTCGAVSDDRLISKPIRTVPAMTLSDEDARMLKRLTTRIDGHVADRDQRMLKAADEGASLREIAAVVDMDHVTVRNRIAKAREKQGEMTYDDVG